MRSILTIASGLLFVLATSGVSLAKCDPNGADATEVAAARAAVKSNCTCDDTVTHGDFVSCAAEQANTVVVNNKSCRGYVKKCAARSTCGKPGFVTCCVTKADGSSKCKTKSSDEKCANPPGGTACVGHFTSCCDACASDGMCVTTTTVAPPTTVP